MHEAAKQGNFKIFEYLIKAIKKRNELIESLLDSYKNKHLNESIISKLRFCKSLQDALEFTDNNNMSPLLIAAKYNNTSIVKFLCLEKANPFVQDQ